MKVWITKWLWSKGIIEVDLDFDEDHYCRGDTLYCLPFSGTMYTYFHGKGQEWHKTKESAVIHAEKMRRKKIESLFKQIYKFEALKFE